mmetsp:Transcript_42747/g.103386  ORF Transcript_42747/g.103386 Transcript_42747/m.103386 type:complete len:469 (-) Transcript_42747:200-1606(-)
MFVGVAVDVAGVAAFVVFLNCHHDFTRKITRAIVNVNFDQHDLVLTTVKHTCVHQGNQFLTVMADIQVHQDVVSTFVSDDFRVQLLGPHLISSVIKAAHKDIADKFSSLGFLHHLHATDKDSAVVGFALEVIIGSWDLLLPLDFASPGVHLDHKGSTLLFGILGNGTFGHADNKDILLVGADRMDKVISTLFRLNANITSSKDNLSGCGIEDGNISIPVNLFSGVGTNMFSTSSGRSCHHESVFMFQVHNLGNRRDTEMSFKALVEVYASSVSAHHGESTNCRCHVIGRLQTVPELDQVVEVQSLFISHFSLKGQALVLVKANNDLVSLIMTHGDGIVLLGKWIGMFQMFIVIQCDQIRHAFRSSSHDRLTLQVSLFDHNNISKAYFWCRNCYTLKVSLGKISSHHETRSWLVVSTIIGSSHVHVPKGFFVYRSDNDQVTSGRVSCHTCCDTPTSSGMNDFANSSGCQ